MLVNFIPDPPRNAPDKAPVRGKSTRDRRHDRLRARYRAGLRAFVRDGSENNLMLAYELAREALARGVQLSEYLAFHLGAVSTIASVLRQSPDARHRVETFVMEFISVYDMALQGYQNAVPLLQKEIADRKRIEEELRVKSAELAAERDNLDAQVMARTQELQAKARDVEKTLEQLRQTNREQAEFTYAISHDLKSPSNTIAMLIQEFQIGHSAVLDADGLELLDLARQTTARMARLVDDVLSYSRCLDNQNPFQRVDINSLISEIIADLRYDMLQSNVDLTVAEMPPVLGDPMQVKLLFQNLISNAFKFRHPDRAPKVVVARKAIAGHRVLITVSDNGIGIAAEHFDRIFGLFQRLHTHNAYRGSGIGLALCKRIAGNLGGDIRVKSQPGVGSSFTVMLNRYPE